MKRSLLIAAILLLAMGSAYAWKPVFVGHRGSLRGVQNTEEAYRNGADFYKYQGLECDVRVTSDGHYVILHDETTGSLCDQNLTVATSTLAELKALTFKQTRDGVAYTGKICTVEEYLDICVEKNCFPMIELKWTTGINNNDMSNFPGLWNLVCSKNLQDKAIFLTSMQSSLAYIKNHYPEATCQYLLSSDSDAKLKFCRENGINPSFSAGALTKSIVTRYRQYGLEVAAWTVNTLANYNKYGNMGVTMMTCDYLRCEDMPELEELEDPGPAPEPVEIEYSTLWTRSAKQGNLPANFPSKKGTLYKTGEMAAVVDGKFYVSDYGTRSILVFDETCTEPVVIPQSDAAFGGTPMHGITTDDAGNIVLRYEQSVNDSPSKVRIFANTASAPVEVEFTLATGAGNHFISASGDLLSPEGGYLYFLPNGKDVVSVVHIASGELKQVMEHKVSISGSAASVIIPIQGPDKYIYMVRNKGFYLYNNGDKGDLYTASSTTTQPTRNSSCGGAYMVIGDHEILAHPSGPNYNGGFSVRDITMELTHLCSFEPIGTEGYDVNASTGTFLNPVKVAPEVYHIYAYTMGNGYGVYEVKAKGAAGIETIEAAPAGNLTVFPNPVRSTAAISSSTSLGVVNIYAMDGRLALSADFADSTLGSLDMTGLNSGVYIAVAADGRRVRIAKI